MRRTPLRPGKKTLERTTELRPKKRLRARSFCERFADDPLRYGPLFEIVRRARCFVLDLTRRHSCSGPGRHTAHHEGETDLGGLLPCCGFVHRGLEGSVNRTRLEYLEELGLDEGTLAGIASFHVRSALEELGIDPDLPILELETELRSLPDSRDMP